VTSLILSLLVWLGTNTDYDIDVALPNIVMTEPYNLCSVYGIDDMGRCKASRLMGFYDKNTTIYLRTSFDQSDLEDKSRLIHELAHYVQWSNGRHHTECLGLLELEAYELQDQWRIEHGLESSLDEFKKIMLSASCDA